MPPAWLMLSGLLLLLLLPAVVLVAGRGTMADDTAYVVQFELSGTGVKDGSTFLLRVEPSWAPRGAKRFRELVEAEFYDDTRFFRVLDGMYDIWIAQFGVCTCVYSCRTRSQLHDSVCAPSCLLNLRVRLACSYASPIVLPGPTARSTAIQRSTPSGKRNLLRTTL